MENTICYNAIQCLVIQNAHDYCMSVYLESLCKLCQSEKRYIQCMTDVDADEVNSLDNCGHITVKLIYSKI